MTEHWFPITNLSGAVGDAVCHRGNPTGPAAVPGPGFCQPPPNDRFVQVEAEIHFPESFRGRGGSQGAADGDFLGIGVGWALSLPIAAFGALCASSPHPAAVAKTPDA